MRFREQTKPEKTHTTAHTLNRIEVQQKRWQLEALYFELKEAGISGVGAGLACFINQISMHGTSHQTSVSTKNYQ